MKMSLKEKLHSLKDIGYSQGVSRKAREISGFLVLVLALSMFTTACGSAGRADLRAKESDSVKKVLTEVDTAWNKGDATAFASHWMEDGTEMDPMGQITEGRANIEKSMSADFAGTLKGSTHKLNVTRVYWTKPDVAVVDGTAEVAIPSGPNEDLLPPWKANFTAILVKDKDNRWIISHLRSYTSMQPSQSESI